MYCCNLNPAWRKASRLFTKAYLPCCGDCRNCPVIDGCHVCLCQPCQHGACDRRNTHTLRLRPRQQQLQQLGHTLRTQHTEQIMQTCRASWQAGGCSISVGYGLHSQRQPHSPLASTQACYEGKISKQKSTQTPSSCPGFAFASSPALPLPAPASALVHPLACAMHAMKTAPHAFVHPHHLFRIKPTKWTCAPG